MKLITHFVFTGGITITALYLLTGSINSVLVLLAVLFQSWIDLFHSRSHGYVRRTWVAHDLVFSLFTVSLPLIIVAQLLQQPLLPSMITGLLTLYNHLMLDFMTGHIYIMGRRIKGFPFEYNDPYLNTVFIALGVLIPLLII